MLAPLSRGPNEHLIGLAGSRAEIGTPALVLDLDALDANIASLAVHARRHGYGVRPVAKVHKSVDIARRQIAAGGLGVCCATLAECEAMAAAGIPGVMLFTSVVTAPKLERLAALNAAAEGLIVVADDAANVEQLAAAGRRSGRPLQVLIDVEVGGRRTGIADPDRAVALARQVAEADGLAYAGVQGYVGDHQNTVDYDLRRARSRELLEPLVRVVERLAAADLAPRIVSGGGTGTHDFDHELGVLSELQAGTYALMDLNYRDAVLRRERAASVRACAVGADDRDQRGAARLRDHRRRGQGDRRDLRPRQPGHPRAERPRARPTRSWATTWGASSSRARATASRSATSSR